MHALLIYYFSQAVYLILAAVFAGFVCSMVNYFLPRALLTRKYAIRVILCLIPVYLGFYTLLFWFCVAGFAQTPASGLILDTGILLGVHALARVAGLYIFLPGTDDGTRFTWRILRVAYR